MSARNLVGLFAIGCVVSACGSAVDSESVDTMEADETAADFEYAPEEVDVEAVLAAKAEQPAELTAKGESTLPRGATFTLAYDLGSGRTLEVSTRDGTSGVDTVLVIFKRCDNSLRWVESPWTDRVCIETLALNDDLGNSRYSRVSYTNPGQWGQSLWVMGFAYGTSTGDAWVDTRTDDGVMWASVVRHFSSGSYAVAAESQSVYTSGGGDPVLFGFGGYVGSKGAWNDDASDGTWESLITGLPGYTWYVPVAIDGREPGNSTVHW